MAYDIEKIRKQVKDRLASSPQDPNEFRPAKTKVGETIKYRFFIVAPLNKGDKCAGGIASDSMGAFAVKHGNHWVNNKAYACPRVSSDEDCVLCETGFALLDGVTDQDQRRAIVRQWLGQAVFTVNTYFPPMDPNPPQLRGRVLYYHAPKTCFDMWYDAINRSSSGTDEVEKEAFGVIYDENASWLYQLECVHQGGYNSYKTSKFLATLGPMPIAMNKDRQPVRDAIDKILALRHDVLTKIDKPNQQVIAQLHAKLTSGADAIKADGPASTGRRPAMEEHVELPIDGAVSNGATLEHEEPVVAPRPTVAPTTAAPAKPAKGAAPAKPAKAAPAKPAPAKVEATVVETEAAGGDDGDESSIQDLLSKLAPPA